VFVHGQADVLKMRWGAKKAVTKDWFGKVRALHLVKRSEQVAVVSVES
jgi:hypothetical protein